MRRTPRWLVAPVLALVLALVTLMGCRITVNGPDAPPRSLPPVAPTNAAGVEQWDLRKRPTAAEVALAADQDVVFYEPDEPRPVVFLLPQGRTLRLDRVTLVTFDRMGFTKSGEIRNAANTPDPTDMDFRTGPVPFDEAYDILRRSLLAIGADPAPADTWREEVINRPTSGVEKDFRIEGGGNTRIGYLGIGVGAVFNPVNENDTATVKFHANFEW